MQQTFFDFLHAYSSPLVTGVMLAVFVLALFVAVTLRERHALITLAFTLTSLLLIYFAGRTPTAAPGTLGLPELLCTLLIVLLALELVLSLQTREDWISILAISLRSCELVVVGFAIAIVLLQKPLATSWALACVIIGAAGTGVATAVAAHRGLRGQHEAYYQAAAWLIICVALIAVVMKGTPGFGNSLLWSLALAAMLLTLSFAHQSLRSRMYWSRKLKESENNGRLLNIERSHRDFSREAQQFLGALEDGAYEEAILTSFLAHLDRLLPVEASAVVLSHRNELRMVTRFQNGDSDNFASILKTREQLLQSVSLSDQAAVIHSDEFGLGGQEHGISTLCIVPVRVERQDWACVLLARSQDSGFQRDELRLIREFSEQARNALVSAEKFDRVRRQAETDALTNLLNRGAILKRANRAFRKARSMGTRLSLFFVDIDNFKTINDSYGHETGDVVLRTVASLCHDCLREKDLVGRYGGEEFIAVLPGADAENAELIAERIRDTVQSTPVQTREITIQVTVSIGIAEMAERFADVNDLVGAADRALYCAKREGRNRVIHDLVVVRDLTSGSERKKA